MKKGEKIPLSFSKNKCIMKKNIKTLFILSFTVVLFSLKANGQQVNSDTYTINQYFKSSNEAALLLKNGINPSIIQSQNSGFSLNQIGYGNQIDVKSNVNNNQTVTQLGNDNEYQFLTYYSNDVSNFNIIQQGNSNTLHIYGENSLVKNLSIVQKANSKAVIVKNY